jgi:NTP pyrophosphatase (non-canonical NTP hydrolase)
MADDDFDAESFYSDQGLDEPPTPDEELRALYRAAWNLWGEIAQMNMVVEEAAELIAAVTHYTRHKNYHDSSIVAARNDIATEIADVRIMCEQLELMLNLSDLVASERRFKLNRLRDRLAMKKSGSGKRGGQV